MTDDRSLLERHTYSMFFKDTKFPNYSLDQIAHLPDYMRSMYVKHMTSKEKAELRASVCRLASESLPPKFIRQADLNDVT